MMGDCPVLHACVKTTDALSIGPPRAGDTIWVDLSASARSGGFSRVVVRRASCVPVARPQHSPSLHHAAGAAVLFILQRLRPGLAVAAVVLWDPSQRGVDVPAAPHLQGSAARTVGEGRARGAAWRGGRRGAGRHMAAKALALTQVFLRHLTHQNWWHMKGEPGSCCTRERGRQGDDGRQPRRRGAVAAAPQAPWRRSSTCAPRTSACLM